MRTVVVDSSFIVAVIMQEELTPLARRTLADLGAADLVAPALLHWEVANVLSRKVRQGAFAAADLVQTLAAFDSLGVQLADAPGEGKLRTLIDLAHTASLSGYDAAYLEIAIAESSELATFDLELAQAARTAGLTVRP